MKGQLSYTSIFKRLGTDPVDADFELVACEKCRCQLLVDHETLRIYQDPENLLTYSLNIVGHTRPVCRGCGLTEWDFAPITTVSSEWEWAYVEEPSDGV